MITSYLIGFGCSFSLAAIVAFFWVKGIDYMRKNHPDYTGDDLFGSFDDEEENERDKHQIM